MSALPPYPLPQRITHGHSWDRKLLHSPYTDSHRSHLLHAHEMIDITFMHRQTANMYCSCLRKLLNQILRIWLRLHHVPLSHECTHNYEHMHYCMYYNQSQPQATAMAMGWPSLHPLGLHPLGHSLAVVVGEPAVAGVVLAPGSVVAKVHGPRVV